MFWFVWPTEQNNNKNIQFTLIENQENQQKQLSVDVVLFVELFCLSLDKKKCSQIIFLVFNRN